MNYYWRIKWKDYNEQELLISEKQAQVINQNLVLENRPERFVINKIPYRYDAIDVVEPTTKKVLDDVKALYAGTAEKLKTGPIIDEEGDVIANWYKKTISSKEYEKYYAGHPSYYTIGRNDSGNVIIAFRKAEEYNGNRAEDIEICTAEETERMWKSYGNFA